MQPTWYFDVEVRGSHGNGFGSACVLAVTSVIAVLHAFFKDRPDCYALDLPAFSDDSRGGRHLGHVVRIFSASEQDATAVADRLKENTRLRDLVMVKPLRPFDASAYDGAWIVLRRFRVAKRSEPSNRRRDLAAAEKMPFVRTRSKTNGHAYTLTLQRQAHLSSPTFGPPNSYGLSGETPVCLPALLV